MADLSVDFAGLKLKNPFIIASSELTNKVEKIKMAEENGASAVSTKLTFLKVPLYARPYHIIEKGGAFYSPSGERMQVEDTQELIAAVQGADRPQGHRQHDGSRRGPRGLGQARRACSKRPAPTCSSSTCRCPNLGLMAKQMGVDEEPELGATLGKDPVLAGQVCKAVVDAVEDPGHAQDDARGQHDDGGAGRCRRPARPRSRPSTARSRCRRSTSRTAAGRCTRRRATSRSPGCAARGSGPLAYRHIAQMRTICPDLPLAGGGGLMNWRHSVEMIMYGATVLTYCSLLYLKGYKAFAKIEPGMRKFMDENGYETLADMRGIALKYIVTPGEVDYIPMLPGDRPGEVQRLRPLRGSRALRVHRDHRRQGRAGEAQGMLLVRGLLLPLRARGHHAWTKAPIEETRAGVAVPDLNERSWTGAESMKAFDYMRPSSLEEACAALAGPDGSAKALAGGTDLLVQMKAGRAAAARARQPQGRPRPRLHPAGRRRRPRRSAPPRRWRRRALAGGAASTSRRIAEAASWIGSVQVRSRATVGGNLCNAAPSADTAPILIAYGAEAIITDGRAERTVPLEDFFTGPGQTVLRPGELLKAIARPAVRQPASAKYFKTFRSAMDCCTVGVAVVRRLRAGHGGRRGRPGGSRRGRSHSHPRAAPARRLLVGRELDDDADRAASAQAAEETPADRRRPRLGRLPQDAGRGPVADGP